MLNRILMAICIIFSIALVISVFMYKSLIYKMDMLETEKNALKGNISFLEKDIEEKRQKLVDADISRRELEREAMEIKSSGGFDWSTALPDDVISARLRKN